MGLFKKLFSAINSGGEKISAAAKKVWVFREPRIERGALKNLSLDVPGSSSHFLISNISSSGIAFVRSRDTDSLKIGSELQGRLKINDDEIEVSMVVARISDKVVACKITNKTNTLDRILRKYFEVQISAMKMIAMKPEHLAPSDDGKPFCFNGENHSRLYYIENNGIAYFEFSFFGFHIEANKNEKIRFGSLVTDDFKDKISYSKSTLVNRNIENTEEIKEIAIQFLAHVEKLNPEHRSILETAIQSGKL